LGPGGAENLLVTFVREAQSRGIKVSVITLCDDQCDTRLPKQIKSLGANLFMYSAIKLYDPRAIFWLAKLFWREKFDVAQAHLSHGVIQGCLVGKLVGLPVVATLHNPSPRKLGHYQARGFLMRVILRYFAKRIIAVGHVVAEAYQKQIEPRTIDVVPNAVNPAPTLGKDERELLRKKMSDDPDKFIIMSVGRLVDGKGLFELLSAFKIVHERIPNSFLVFIGDGVLRGQLESYSLALGIDEHINFLGDQRDVPSMLSAGDMYVSASYSEGLSMALLEAMAAGLPILATDVGDAPVLLADGRGVLLSPKDESLLAEKMYDLINQSPEMRRSMGEKARSYVEKNHSPAAWVDQLVSIYKSVDKS
jgi:glycosyltransferase involved in cell wall biosynthesis